MSIWPLTCVLFDPNPDPKPSWSQYLFAHTATYHPARPCILDGMFILVLVWWVNEQGLLLLCQCGVSNMVLLETNVSLRTCTRWLVIFQLTTEKAAKVYSKTHRLHRTWRVFLPYNKFIAEGSTSWLSLLSDAVSIHVVFSQYDKNDAMVMLLRRIETFPRPLVSPNAI